MMSSSRSVRATSEGDRVHLLLPGVEGLVVLSAAEAVDLLEQLRSLGPVLNEETARVSDRMGQEREPIERASRPAGDHPPRDEDLPAGTRRVPDVG